MSTAQIASVPRPAYEFLSHPPPPKTRPTQPLPSTPKSPFGQVPPLVLSAGPRRPRSHSTTIPAWAAQIQPGSPAPVSPPCPSPLVPRRRSSLTRRRASLNTPRVPSNSFLTLVDTPSAATPSLKDWTPDLSALGYAYAVVPLPLPTTPVSAPLPAKKERKEKKAKGRTPPPIIVPLSGLRSPSRTPSPKKKPTRFARLLRPRSPKGRPSSPHLRKQPISAPALSPTSAATAIAARKKQQYARTGVAPSVDNELALMQLLDGGSAEQNLARLQGRGAGVFRDTDGVWVDQDEPFEFAPLLAGPADNAWEQFEESSAGTSPASEDLALAVRVAEAPATNPAVPLPAARTLLTVPARGRHRTGAPSYVRVPASFTPPRSPNARVQMHRRRPAPLTLRPPPTPTRHASNSPLGFADAFEPEARRENEKTVAVQRTIRKTPSRMNIGMGVRGLLKAMGGG